MIKVAASILTADFSCLLQEVKRMELAGADWLHIDVMDGCFVPNITMGPPVVRSLKGRVNLFLDVHLMVQHPEAFLSDFCQAGAAAYGSCRGHAHLHRVVQMIKKRLQGRCGSEPRHTSSLPGIYAARVGPGPYYVG